MKKYYIWHNNTDSAFTDKVEAERTFVGAVLATGYGNAFVRAQNDFNEDYARLGVRSTCVGDMIQDCQTGKCYVVQGMGFEVMPAPGMAISPQ